MWGGGGSLASSHAATVSVISSIHACTDLISYILFYE